MIGGMDERGRASDLSSSESLNVVPCLSTLILSYTRSTPQDFLANNPQYIGYYPLLFS